MTHSHTSSPLLLYSNIFATGARSPEERAAEGLSAEDSPPPINKPYSKGKGSLYEGGVRALASTHHL